MTRIVVVFISIVLIGGCLWLWSGGLHTDENIDATGRLKYSLSASAVDSSNLIGLVEELSALEESVRSGAARQDRLENKLNSLIETLNSNGNNFRYGEVFDSAASNNNQSESRKQLLQEWLYQQNENSKPEKELQRAGFTPERASWIVQREEELKLEQAYIDWEQRRQAFLNGGADLLSAHEMLRNELTESDYGKYLEAKGKSASITVKGLIGGSLAERTGLQPGDEILNYNGQPVYNKEQLGGETIKQALGEPATIIISRDGREISLDLEYGPLGVELTDKPTRSRFR